MRQRRTDTRNPVIGKTQPELAERLKGLLGFWEEKAVFDPPTMRALHQAMQCPDPFAASQLLPPVPHPMPVVRDSLSLSLSRLSRRSLEYQSFWMTGIASLGVVETCEVVLGGALTAHGKLPG